MRSSNTRARALEARRGSSAELLAHQGSFEDTAGVTVLDHELAVALDVVQRCGELALAMQAGGDASLQTAHKANDQGPVTRADLAVEKALLEALHEHFPKDAILAEESAGSTNWSSHERVWMIDPIDGTKDFAEGDPSWAIHVALTIDGRPALGIVHEPANRRLCWAIDHLDVHKAWCRREGENCVEALHGLGRLPPRWRLVTSKSHRSERLDAIMQRLEITADQTLRTASTGVKLAMVARGAAEIYAHPTLGTKLWDSAAPQVVLHASGGRLTDMRGQPLVYDKAVVDNRFGLLASYCAAEHDALVEQLRPLVDEWF
jgi:3'-phosphoadenosine 5'-phosphosulfate (PAPS) 3'-phosphatase